MRQIVHNLIKILIVTSSVLTSANANDLTHSFKSPSFSGIGFSTHVLTIHQLEQNRKDQLKEDRQSALDLANRELKSTNMYKFQNNLESRIYAQLSKEIADSLFGEESGLIDTSWKETDTAFGDKIKWKRENDIIYVEIYDSNGTLASEFQTPVGEFAF